MELLDKDRRRDRLLREHMAEGFCVLRVVFDPLGRPVDLEILEVNAAYERLSGLHGAAGRKLSELVPDYESPWLGAFATVARKGEAVRLEQRSARLDRWFDVLAFPWGARGDNLVGAVFNDVTEHKLDAMMAQSVLEYAIVLLDPEGRVRTWNAGARRIKGHAPEDILGRHFSAFYTDEDRARDLPARVLAQADATGQYVGEGWRVRRDGSRFWASVTVTALRDGQGKLQGFCKLTRDLSERRRAEQRLQDLNQSLEAQVCARTDELRRANAELVDARDRLQVLSARLIRAQEEERGRIARELHDGTGQLLTFLRMRLDKLAGPVPDGSVKPCQDLVDQIIDHTRRMALNLRPAMLDDLGLEAALEWMLEQQGRAAGWETSFASDLAGQRFAHDVETACFRIAQEALTNAARHARATKVSLSVSQAGGRLQLKVLDNGGGFDLAEFSASERRTRHFGLVSVRERAALVGAAFTIDSMRGRGTRVAAVFPLHDPPGDGQAA